MAEVMLALVRTFANLRSGRVWLYLLTPALFSLLLTIGLAVWALGAVVQAMMAAPRPRPIPTRGKVRMARARSPMPASGSGRRVRNTAARWVSPSQDRGGGFSSMTGDSLIVMGYRTAKAVPQYVGEKFLEFDYF